MDAQRSSSVRTATPSDQRNKSAKTVQRLAFGANGGRGKKSRKRKGAAEAADDEECEVVIPQKKKQ